MLKKHGLAGVNKPKRTPSHPKKSDNKDDAPKAKKPKKRAGIPSTTAKQTIVTNEMDNS